MQWSGPQAWYSEFGTGTRGQLQPHPYKGKYALNPYNSGKTIRPASEKVSQKEGAKKAEIKKGDLYWTYIGEDGKLYYSKGVPAQKIVYDAGQLAKRRLNPTIKKHMKGMFE